MTEEEKEAIERAKRELQKTTFLTDIAHKDLKTILNLIQKQQKEDEEKEKTIDLMATRVYLNEQEREEMKEYICMSNKPKDFKSLVKQYFKKQAKEV